MTLEPLTISKGEYTLWVRPPVVEGFLTEVVMQKFTAAYLLSFPSKTSLIERLRSKITEQPSGCWYYTGSTDNSGYGKIAVGKHRLGAHKVMYLLAVGDYDQQLELMHSCDNPNCVNPAHLSPATHSDNIQDCVDKGRHPWTKQGMSTRKQAIANGESTYVGKPCKTHNISIRRTTNEECVECYECHKAKLRDQNRSSKGA